MLDKTDEARQVDGSNQNKINDQGATSEHFKKYGALTANMVAKRV